MRRLMILLISLIMCVSIYICAWTVESPGFSVNVVGTQDSGHSFNGQDTLAVDWQIMANKDGMTLRYAQGLRLAYDNTILQLMTWDGSGEIPDSMLGENMAPIPHVGHLGDFDTGLVIYAARNTTGKRGYLNYLLGDPFSEYDCPQGTYVSLAQIRFAFREGKSAADLTADSIRTMTVSELDAASQSTVVLLNTDENELTSYEYLKQAGGVAVGGDTLNAPIIIYPGSSISSNNDDIDDDTVDNTVYNDEDVQAPIVLFETVDQDVLPGNTNTDADLAWTPPPEEITSTEEALTLGGALNSSDTQNLSQATDENLLGPYWYWIPIATAGAVLTIAVVMWALHSKRKAKSIDEAPE